MKEKFKQKKGITLIALVVTIVVLIILAGVSINILLGKNGIIKKAKIAKEETRGGAVLEARDLWIANKQTDKQTNTSTAQTLDELLANLKKQNQLTDEEIAIIKETGSIKIGSKNIEFGKGAMTLVEMFKKAEVDNCLNLDGKCMNEEHLHIGDYVNYQNPTSGSYTITGEKSGVKADQTYEVEKNQLNWRVLGIDETTGGIKLIAGSPMKLNDIEGKSDPYLYLYGAWGAEYGCEEMDKVGSLYKNEYAIEARSVKMEDINQIAGIKTEEDIIKVNIAPLGMVEGTKQYGESYSIENQYTPIDWINGNEAKTIIGRVDGYEYNINESYGIDEGLPYVSISNTRAFNMLFNNTEELIDSKWYKGKAYWIATNCVLARSDDAIFSLFHIFGKIEQLSPTKVHVANLFHTNGKGAFVIQDGLRPVVLLNANITTDEINKIADQKEEEWKYDTDLEWKPQTNEQV